MRRSYPALAARVLGPAFLPRGRARAPLELAVPITSKVILRPEDHRLPVVRIALTVRELRDALWPHGIIDTGIFNPRVGRVGMLRAYAVAFSSLRS